LGMPMSVSKWKIYLTMNLAKYESVLNKATPLYYFSGEFT
jgi:hypothetical protein